MTDVDGGPAEKSYPGQKKEVLELLTEYITRGNCFIENEKQPEADRQEVETGLLILREAVIGFYAFLEKSFEAGGIVDPSVLNIAQFFRAAIGGASFAFSHLEKSEAVRIIVRDEVAEIARKAKSAIDEPRKEKQMQVLRESIDHRPVIMPYKEADNIFDTETERKKLEALCKLRGIEMFSKSTARRRFDEMKVQP